jgi:hypothetical protein
MLELSVQHKESKLPTYPQGFAIILTHHSIMPYHTISLMLFSIFFLLTFVKDEAWCRKKPNKKLQKLIS